MMLSVSPAFLGKALARSADADDVRVLLGELVTRMAVSLSSADVLASRVVLRRWKALQVVGVNTARTFAAMVDLMAFGYHSHEELVRHPMSVKVSCLSVGFLPEEVSVAIGCNRTCPIPAAILRLLDLAQKALFSAHTQLYQKVVVI